MRRALLFVLVAAMIVVAGWSATMAMASPAPLIEPAVVVANDARTGSIELGGQVADDAVAPALVRAAAPAARLLLERDRAVAVIALVLLGALVAVAERPSSWAQGPDRGAPQRRAPALRVAPHRGPPVGLARPSGT